MFRLSQSSRRRLFRTGFLLVCVAPLIALVAAGWQQHRSGYVHSHENALRHTLGMRVHIGQVSHPRPGVVRYQELHLANPETGHTFAKFRVAEVRQPVSADKPAELIMHGTTIEPGATTSLFRMIEELLRGSFRNEDLHVTFSTDAITFDETAPFPQLKGVSGTVRSTDKCAEARIEFRSAEPEIETAEVKMGHSAMSAKSPLPKGTATANSENKIELSLVRNRQNGEMVEEFELHTGAVEVPCETLAPLAGGDLSGLAGSRFQGSVWASHAKGVVVRGRLLDINLQRLVGDSFGHRVNGKLDAQIRHSHCIGGRLTEADLTIEGGPGSISRALLAAANNGLKLGPKFDPGSPINMIDYTQVAARIQLFKEGEIKITGGCKKRDGIATDGVMMTLDDGAWWREPPQPQPLSGLLRALATPDGPTAPASTQIGWLMARLPIEKTTRSEQPLMPVAAPQLQREAQPPKKPRDEPAIGVKQTSGSQELPVLPGFPGPYGP